MFRRRARSDLHRSAIRLSLFDAVLLAPVIALPLLFVVSLALFSMVTLLVLTGAAVAPPSWVTCCAASGVARQPVVVPRRALG